MSFKPLKGRVVIKREDPKEELHGFFIPENARERPNRGTVRYIADDVTEVKPGDCVMFGKYDGTEAGKGYLIDGEELLIMNESQIWAVLQ